MSNKSPLVFIINYVVPNDNKKIEKCRDSTSHSMAIPPSITSAAANTSITDKHASSLINPKKCKAIRYQVIWIIWSIKRYKISTSLQKDSISNTLHWMPIITTFKEIRIIKLRTCLIIIQEMLSISMFTISIWLNCTKKKRRSRNRNRGMITMGMGMLIMRSIWAEVEAGGWRLRRLNMVIVVVLSGKLDKMILVDGWGWRLKSKTNLLATAVSIGTI